MEHLLVIEDDARISAMVADYLGRSGFRISQAPNAAEGLNHIQTGPRVDLVILDLMLPDRDARSVTLGGALCELTSYQFDLLMVLAERAGRVLTRDQIMELVRGKELEAFDRSIDVHVGRIRQAIEADVKSPKRVLTVRGVGYMFAKQQD